MATRKRRFTILGAALLVGGLVMPASAADEIPGPDEAATSGVSRVEERAPAFGPIGPLPALRRRASHNVPLFVGPSQRRVSGTRGIHRWDEIRFGAQEVTVSAHTSRGQAPCLVSLRLAEGGDRFVDGGFELDPSASASAEATLDVDYATAAMRVASTCSDWALRFEPLEDPELPYEIDERTYAVRGASIAEILPQTNRLKGRWAAYTEWTTSWQYDWDESDESCTIDGGSTSLDASVTYPDWKRPSDVDAADARNWDRFMRNLRIHELGHVTIALQGADAIDDRLDARLALPTCDEVEPYADEAARKILGRYNAQSRRYDRETGHGLTQGTGLR